MKNPGHDTCDFSCEVCDCCESRLEAEDPCYHCLRDNNCFCCPYMVAPDRGQSARLANEVVRLHYQRTYDCNGDDIPF